MLSFFSVSHILKEEHGKAYPDKGGYIAGSSSFLKPILLPRPTPLRYAQQALLSDPASRLIILIDINPGDGTGQFHHLQTNSKSAPLKINRLVDLMEGIWLGDEQELFIFRARRPIILITAIEHGRRA